MEARNCGHRLWMMMHFARPVYGSVLATNARPSTQESSGDLENYKLAPKAMMLVVLMMRLTMERKAHTQNG